MKRQVQKQANQSHIRRKLVTPHEGMKQKYTINMELDSTNNLMQLWGLIF